MAFLSSVNHLNFIFIREYQDSEAFNSADKDVCLSEESILPSTGNIFLNVTYDLNKKLVILGSQLIRKWRYTAYVSDTTGADVSGANVAAYDRAGTCQFNLTTNSQGQTGTAQIADYINNTGTKTDYSNYSTRVSFP